MPTKKEIWGRIFVNTFILCYSKLTKMIQLMIEYNMVVVLNERIILPVYADVIMNTRCYYCHEKFVGMDDAVICLDTT